MYRILRTIICCIMLAGIFSSIALCESSSQVTPRFTHIQKVSVYVDANVAEGVVYYGGNGKPLDMDTRAYIVVKLQRHPVVSGSWTTVETGSARGLIGGYAGYSGSYPYEANYKYRTYILCTVFDANGKALESHTMYSPIEP